MNTKHFVKYYLAFLVLSLSLISCKTYYNIFYADPNECFEQAKLLKPFDAIIVPGFPYFPDSTNAILIERVNWANYLYKNGYTHNIIFSGSAVHSPYIEAEIMRQYALKLGIPDSNILLETKAEHTTENLYYSKLLADKNSFNSIAFATQPAQASFMKPFNRKWKLNYQMLPIVTSCIDSFYIKSIVIDASSAFVNNFVPLKKREGILKSLRGTRGHNVKKLRRHVRKNKN